MNSWQTLDIIARTEHRQRAQAAERRAALLSGRTRRRRLEWLKRWATSLNSERAPVGRPAGDPVHPKALGSRITPVAVYRRQR